MVFTKEIMINGWQETKKGKSEQNNYIIYNYNLEYNLYTLQNKLQNHTFHPSPLRLKTITVPKKRIAQVPSLEDKIVQHVICDNYAYQNLTKSLIKETGACLIGRGTDYSKLLLEEQLRKFYREYKVFPYILKIDISKYFASILIPRCIELINRYITDEEVKYIMNEFLKLTDRGLPLGLQQSQLLTNLYLSDLDHKIKEKYKCKYYGRYMDDFYIISNDLEFLQFMWKEIDKYVQTIGLTLNPKTDIFYNKIEYLGFSFKLTKTGKVIKTLINSKKNTQKHRIRKQVKELVNNKISADKLASSYQGWRQHAIRGHTRNAVLDMDKAFDNMLSAYNYKLIVGEGGKIKIWQEKYNL